MKENHHKNQLNTCQHFLADKMRTQYQIKQDHYNKEISRRHHQYIPFKKEQTLKKWTTMHSRVLMTI